MSRLPIPFTSDTLFSLTRHFNRVLKKLWPEVEVNATFWPDGTNDGNKQVFLTPGIVLGRFPIRNRLGFTVGGGVQIAATHFHQYNHNWILSLRLPF